LEPVRLHLKLTLGYAVTSSRPVLITGTAGFIGFHLSQRLLAEGRQVIGLDSMNEYYDVFLK